MERVTIRIDGDDPSPWELKGYFSEVFASLDENPRPLLLSVFTANDRHARVSLSIKEGEPVFIIEGRESVKADFHGRWLARHPSPFVFAPDRTRLFLEPTTGDRISVRPLSRFENFMVALGLI